MTPTVLQILLFALLLILSVSCGCYVIASGIVPDEKAKPRKIVH